MPSIIHQNRNLTPQKLAFDLASKAILFRSLIHNELNKELLHYRQFCPKNTDQDLQKGDWSRFPLLHRYLHFHTQLVSLEKNNCDEERKIGFASFADMYAQTATYGLLAARWMSKDETTPFTRTNIRSLLPSTSNFLKGVAAVYLKP